jgi:hypothetical protein
MLQMSTGWKRFFKFLDIRALSEDLNAEKLSPASLLEKGLQFIRPTDAKDVAAPLEGYLASLPVERLFDVDERLRSCYGTPLRDWPSNAVAEIASSTMQPSMRMSLLFLTASHGNGRIRQEAVEVLPRFPGRLTLAAALIRCGDWVPEIKVVAQRTVAQLLELCTNEDTLAVWPLAIRLQLRGRVDSEWFRGSVEGWLLYGDSSGLLLNLLQGTNSTVRAWAYEKSFNADVSLAVGLLDSAIRDSNPRIALLALGYSLRCRDESHARALAKIGVDASHPTVRRESLRALAGLESTLPRELIYKALCDHSAGVRSLGAYLLRERYSEPALEYWRDVIDRDVGRPTLGALASLADNAQAIDVSRFKRWLRYPKGLVRLLCLRGITKVDGRLSDEEFLQVVADSSAQVRRALAVAVRRGAIPLDASRLVATATAESSTAITQKRLRELLRQLNPWDRLSLILDIHPRQESELLWFVTVLGDWIADSKRYAPLGPVRRSKLLGVLMNRRGEMDDLAFQQIQKAISCH